MPAETNVPALRPTPDELGLSRYPVDARDQLRAWNAADEYLLAELPEDLYERKSDNPIHVVVVNDSWGALVTALCLRLPETVQIHQLSDSYLAQQATQINLAHNDIPADRVSLLASFDPVPSDIDVLLVKVPKTLALLEDQLGRLAGQLRPDTIVIGTGMVSDIHTSTSAAFERLIGPTRTSLARKKARLIYCTPNPALIGQPPAASSLLSYQVPADVGGAPALTLWQHPGVFSANHLDRGTRLLLQHLPPLAAGARVLDLGCGNGVLGLAAARTEPSSEVTFVDESYRAIASARENAEQHLPGRSMRFLVGDSASLLTEDGPERYDVVLLNPPFHDRHAQSTDTAWRMLADSRRALRPAGELYLVGNRHLAYHVAVKRIFGQADVVASDPGFVVLRARRLAS